MNERPRRHQSSAAGGGHSSNNTRRFAHNSSNQETPSSLNYLNNRPTHHNHRHQQQGVPSNSINQRDTYSSNNYRHPSTTTTTIEPSSIGTSQSSEDGCARSILYSYLIAIISSFLVVLGIYFALTKFNLRYLYLSLLGISIEAIGACIYCISNIKASRVSRRKDARINSDEFVLNGGVQHLRGPHRNIDNDQGGAAARVQPQINTITYILSNSTLTSGNRNNNNQNDTTPQDLDEQVATEARTPPRVAEDDQVVGTNIPEHGDIRDTRHDDYNDESTVITLGNDQIDITPPSVPPRRSEPPSYSIASETPTSSQILPKTGEIALNVSLLGHDEPDRLNPKSNLDMEGELRQSASRLAKNMVSRFDTSTHSYEGDKNTKVQASFVNSSFSMPTANDLDDEQQDEVQPEPLPRTTSRRGEVRLDLTSQLSVEQGPSRECLPNSNDLKDRQRSGLKPSVIVDGEPQVVRRQDKSPQTRANLRRTLVMGLGGEEEVIEVDEEDLDNMSILPPPYESLISEMDVKRSPSI